LHDSLGLLSDSPDCHDLRKKMKYPVITVHQPWAQWIIEGFKEIETRTHDRFKSLEGKRILIHASQTHQNVEDVALNYYTCGKYPKGVILGSAQVYDALWLCDVFEDEANCECNGLFGLCLKDVKKFKNPIPAKGKQGIWYYDI